MKNDTNVINSPRNRRSFLKTGLAAAGANRENKNLDDGPRE